MVLSDSGDTSDFSEYSFVGHDAVGSQKKEVKKYPCTYGDCQLIFSRPFRLAAHLCVHTGEKPFPCTWQGCNKAYTNKSHLSRHVKSVHQKVVKTWKYRCSHCKDLFMTSQNLKKHISRLHECEYPYKCSICHAGFKKKNILAQHMFYHTGNDPFECSLCGKTFSELINFNKHKRNHKIFHCFCKEVFTKWSDMVKHKKLIHTQSEYVCDICQKIFKSRILIVKHIRSHSTDKIVYQCTYDDCPKFYSSKYNLLFHIQSYHKHLTFNCSVDGCNAKLATKAKLQFHMSKHNNTSVIPKKPRQPRERNKRKDAGSFKRSTAVKLVGINLSASEEKNLLENLSDETQCKVTTLTLQNKCKDIIDISQ